MPTRWREEEKDENNEAPEWLMAPQIYSSLKLGRSFTVLEQEQTSAAGAVEGVTVPEQQELVSGRRPLRHVDQNQSAISEEVYPATSGFEVVEDVNLHDFFNPRAAHPHKRAEDDRAYSLLLQLPRVNGHLADGEVWSSAVAARPSGSGRILSGIDRTEENAGSMELLRDKLVYRARPRESTGSWNDPPRLERLLEIQVWQPKLATPHFFYMSSEQMSISLQCQDGQLKLSFQVGDNCCSDIGKNGCAVRAGADIRLRMSAARTAEGRHIFPPTYRHSLFSSIVSPLHRHVSSCPRSSRSYVSQWCIETFLGSVEK